MTTNSTPVILSISQDERLAHVRQMVLESEGWQVVTTTDTVDALQWLATGNFDVAVLGHSIPPAERVSLAQKIKVIRPDLPIVMVCVQGDNAFSKQFADERVGSLDGPVALIDVIRRLTRQQDGQCA
jgi:DNA-binding NtrC family response regulator